MFSIFFSIGIISWTKKRCEISKNISINYESLVGAPIEIGKFGKYLISMGAPTKLPKYFKILHRLFIQEIIHIEKMNIFCPTFLWRSGFFVLCSEKLLRAPRNALKNMKNQQ